MLKMMTITAIIAAIVAILTEIFCTEARAKTFWLGTISLYFLVSTGAFYLLWHGGVSGNVGKQILIFVVVAMSAFLVSVVTASAIMMVFDQFAPDKEQEGPEKKSGEEGNEKENA
ncbi:MAG: hypothetical protein IKO80_08685 [Lachnospiraceae bacterium]|nr:hypothetical protein [Lachnospiraceae bacterium]